MDDIKPGKYKHYKGNLYEVLSFAKHSETLEEMVVYRALYGDGGTWVRPVNMWNETVSLDGKTIKRFEYIENKIEEDAEILFENDKIKVEYIYSYGVVSDSDSWFNNKHDEWVNVVKGSAVLEFENEKIKLKASENYYIKAHVKHRVDFTSADCEWLCVYVKK